VSCRLAVLAPEQTRFIARPPLQQPATPASSPRCWPGDVWGRPSVT
jgi:hypothetical protein